MIEPGLGFDRDVGLVAVAVFADALVHVPGLGIDRRDHPVRCDPLRDPPRPVTVAGFDVLARDQRQQADRVGLLGVERDVVERVEDRQRVVDQPVTSASLASGSSHAHTGLPDAS